MRSTVSALLTCMLLSAGCSALGQESRLGRPDTAPLPRKTAEAVCKSRVSADAAMPLPAAGNPGVSDAFVEERVRRLAIRQWRDKAQQTYGSEYDRWFAANGKDVVCRIEGNAVRCLVTAAPCSGHSAGSSAPQH